MPGVAPSEGGSFVTVTVRARMCDVGGSFPRVRVGCCHQHVRMRMRCSTLFSLLPLLLSFPLSPLLLGRVTLGDRTLLPRIIMPSSSSLASASPSSRPLLWTQILPGNIQGESHTLHKAFCGGKVCKRFSTNVSCCLKCPLSTLRVEWVRWEGVNHLQLS